MCLQYHPRIVIVYFSCYSYKKSKYLLKLCILNCYLLNQFHKHYCDFYFLSIHFLRLLTKFVAIDFELVKWMNCEDHIGELLIVQMLCTSITWVQIISCAVAFPWCGNNNEWKLKNKTWNQLYYNDSSTAVCL